MIAYGEHISDSSNSRPSRAYRGTLASHLAGLAPSARSAAASSVAGAQAVAAGLPARAGHLLTQAANTAYAHGAAHATVVGAALLIVGAVLCAIFLPGKPPRAATKEAGPSAR
jgi:hypothetical protein